MGVAVICTGVAVICKGNEPQYLRYHSSTAPHSSASAAAAVLRLGLAVLSTAATTTAAATTSDSPVRAPRYGREPAANWLGMASRASQLLAIIAAPAANYSRSQRWGTVNSLRNSERPADHLDPLVFSSSSTEFPSCSDDIWEWNAATSEKFLILDATVAKG